MLGLALWPAQVLHASGLNSSLLTMPSQDGLVMASNAARCLSPDSSALACVGASVAGWMTRALWPALVLLLPVGLTRALWPVCAFIPRLNTTYNDDAFPNWLVES